MRTERASVLTATAARRYRFVIAVVLVGLTAGCATSPRSSDHAQAVTTTRSTTTSSIRTTTTTTIPTVTYQVQRGDTLTKIAQHFHVSISALMSANQITNADQLTAGQTLQIPPAPPVKLTVDPPEGPAGSAFHLALTGAIPNETITFQIHSPTGTYTGGPHTATADGRVTATYTPDPTATIGTYTVIATGNLGTNTRAGFIVTRP